MAGKPHYTPEQREEKIRIIAESIKNLNDHLEEACKEAE